MTLGFGLWSLGSGRRVPFRRLTAVVTILIALLLVAPPPANAYVGPGAGFALLSSFLVLFTTTLAALASLLFWPFRLLWRRLRGGRPPQARIKRLVIVGLDGQDPMLTDQFMARGRAAELQEAGREGVVPPAADDVPVGLAGGVVVVQHGHAPATAQHLRLSRIAIVARTCRSCRRHTSGASTRFFRIGRYPHSARTAGAAAAPEVEAVLDGSRRTPHLEHDPARADHVSAGSILRRGVERDVRAGSARHAGHVPAVHDAPGWRALQGGRHPGCQSPSRAVAIETSVEGPENHVRRGRQPSLRVPLRMSSTERAERRTSTPAATSSTLAPGQLSDWVTSTLQGRSRDHGVRYHAHARARDGRPFFALRVADQPRSREAGDADLASVVLRDLPGEDGSARTRRSVSPRTRGRSTKA